MHPMKRHPLFGLSLALLGGLTITPDTLFMRWSQMNGLEMLAWRGLLMGTILLAAWAVLVGRAWREELRALRASGAAVVVVSQFVSSALFALGIARAPVPVVLFGVASVPVFSAIFAFLLMGEDTHWTTWVAIVAVMSGIGVAVFGNAPGAVLAAGSPLLGAAAGLGVAMSLALNFVAIRRNPQLPILLAVGCGAFLSGAAALSMIGPGALLGGHIWAIAMTGLVILPVSFFSLALASRYTPATNASLFMLLETVLGPLWVWAGTGERPTHAMFAGGIVVVGSLTLYLGYAARRQARAGPHTGSSSRHDCAG